jgi:hypothetical protein
MTLIEIKDCNECKDLKTSRTPTGDSFDVAYDWICGINNKKIQSYVCTFDKNPPIPAWCPRTQTKVHDTTGFYDEE